MLGPSGTTIAYKVVPIAEWASSGSKGDGCGTLFTAKPVALVDSAEGGPVLHSYKPKTASVAGVERGVMVVAYLTGS